MRGMKSMGENCEVDSKPEKGKKYNGGIWGAKAKPSSREKEAKKGKK